LFGIDYTELWHNYVILIAITVGLRVLAYLGLKFLYNGKKSLFAKLFGKLVVEPENQPPKKSLLSLKSSSYQFSN
jgi:hypothetical protein